MSIQIVLKKHFERRTLNPIAFQLSLKHFGHKHWIFLPSNLLYFSRHGGSRKYMVYNDLKHLQPAVQAFNWKEESTQEKEKLMMWCTHELLGLCLAFLPHMVWQGTMETVAPSHSPTSTFHLVPTLLTALCTLPKFFLCFENKKWRLKGY